MDLIAETQTSTSGYLHIYRVAGDLFDSWAIEPSPTKARERAMYGPEKDGVVDESYGMANYCIRLEQFERNGWTVRIESVSDEQGRILTSREV